jgi:hypothetical protein
MDSIYKCVVTKVNPETNEETIVLDEEYTGLTLLADCSDKTMGEVIIHDNLMNIASKLANGSKTAVAVRLANLLMDIKEKETDSKESALMRAIMGDICNE